MFMYLLVALTFVAVFLLVFAVNLLFADMQEGQRKRLRERLDEEHRLQQQERARASMQFHDLYELAAEESALDKPRISLRERSLLTLEQAGLRSTPFQLIFVSLLLAATVGALVGFIAGSPVWGGVSGIIAASLPWAYVAMLRQQRLMKLQSQLPDAFDLMSRTMRAGQTISQALQTVAEESSSPLCEEFGLCFDQQNLGMSPEAAMRDLARRTGLLEIKIFVLAVMVHRQTGGNMAVLLEKLSSVIRDRYRIQGVIRTLTAEGRAQAMVLMALPIGMLLLMLVINRPYAMVLFDRPVILLVMVTSMAIGGLWMRKIINFEV